MSHQKIWRRNGRPFQQGMKFVYHALGRSRQRTGVAPTETGAVIRHNSIRSSKLASDRCPTQNRGHQPSFENNRWASTSFLHQMQAMSTQIDEPTRWGVESTVPLLTQALVSDSAQQSKE